MPRVSAMRTGLVALTLLAIASATLAGCGRKGALEPPPPREGGTTAATSPAQPPVPTAAP